VSGIEHGVVVAGYFQLSMNPTLNVTLCEAKTLTTEPSTPVVKTCGVVESGTDPLQEKLGAVMPVTVTETQVTRNAERGTRGQLVGELADAATLSVQVLDVTPRIFSQLAFPCDTVAELSGSADERATVPGATCKPVKSVITSGIGRSSKAAFSGFGRAKVDTIAKPAAILRVCPPLSRANCESNHSRIGIRLVYRIIC
jgi:hypothetical protein